ncbi:MAG: CHAT domain-containing protein [Scytonema sp. RU_4_4]|nr:CHAT domain-containing protein [Scytonema sp. RU_4_4]NJR74467.1 CHAT domain-containing protein [Scytonema sp. CRU_2_7]
MPNRLKALSGKGETEQLLNLCREHLSKNQFQDALQSCQQAAKTAQATGDRSIQAKSLTNLGSAYLKTGNVKQALTNYQQALAIAQEIQEHDLESQILIILGDAYHASGDSAKAIDYYQKSLLIIQKQQSKNPPLGALLNKLSSTYIQSRRQSEGIVFFEKQRSIAKNGQNPSLEVSVLGFLAFQYQASGNLQKAVNIREEQIEILQKTKPSWVALSQGSILAGLCENYKWLKDYSKAINCFEQGLKFVREDKNNPDAAIRILNSVAEYNYLLGLGFVYKDLLQLGFVYKEKNLLRESIKFLESAHAIQQELKNNQELLNNALLKYKLQKSGLLKNETEENTIETLGLNYWEIGEHNKAIDYFKKLLSSADTRRQGNAHILLGGVYAAQTKYDFGLDHFNRAIKIARDTKEPQLELIAYRHLSYLYAFIGDFEKAIEPEKKALEIAQRFKNCSTEGKIYLPSQSSENDFVNQLLPQQRLQEVGCNFFQLMEVQGLLFLGILYQSNDSQIGMDYIKQGLELSQKLKKPDEEATAFQFLASAHFNRGDWKNAIKYYEKAIALDSGSTDTSTLPLPLFFKWNTKTDLLQSLAEAYAANGNLDKALQIQRKAELSILPDANLHGLARSLSNRGFLYFLAKDTAKAEKLLSEAMDKFESILDKGVGNQDPNRVSFFDSYVSTYQTLEEVLIAQNKIKEALEISERGRARVFAELLANRSSRNTKNREIEIQTPKITIQQIQQIAKQQNATLVEYRIVYDRLHRVPFSSNNKKSQLPEAKLFIWVIKPTGEVTFHQVDLQEAIQQQNTSLANLVVETKKSIISQSFHAANDPSPQLKQLHQLLIERIAGLLPKDINSRVIFIPDGELFLIPFSALLDTSNKYLIEKHTISIAPSIQILDLTYELARRNQGLAKDILIVGNPTMPYEQELGQPLQKLQELPNEETQANEIAALFKTKAIIGTQATESNIVQQMPKARIIHLGTHAKADEQQGLNSWIALAPSGKDDGFLRAEEIFNLFRRPQGLPLSAELIVLSACQTGKGKITGDGVVGLSRSLIASGVPSVVISLWTVVGTEDEVPSNYLMKAFYENLLQKSSKTQAMTEAMRTTMKKYPQPGHWAAFTLIGEAE